MGKMTASQRVLAALNRGKKDADKAAMASAGSKSEIREIIPTGIDALDCHVLGTGGLVAGRIYEVFSDASAGKSSLGFQFLAMGQLVGGMSALLTTEDDLLVSRATTFGCDTDDLILREPGNLEELLDALRDLLRAIPKDIGPNVIVWDSLAATELTGQQDMEFRKAQFVGTRARAMSNVLPFLARIAVERRAAVIVINQIRSKIGVLIGNKETTPGGHALKFHASARLQLWGGAAYPEGSRQPKGVHTTIKAVKNKLALPLRKAKLRLNFEEGWDNEWSLMNLAKDLKVLPEKAVLSKANLQIAREAICSNLRASSE